MPTKRTVKGEAAEIVKEKLKEAASKKKPTKSTKTTSARAKLAQKKKIAKKEETTTENAPVEEKEFQEKLKNDVERATGEKQPEKEELTEKPEIAFNDTEENWVPDVIDDELLNDKKYLTIAELAELNFYAEKHKTFQKDAEILNLKREVLLQKKKVAEMQVELEKKSIVIVEFQMKEYRYEKEAFKAKNREFLKGISKKYEIPEDTHWGYDPESGEIIIDER